MFLDKRQQHTPAACKSQMRQPAGALGSFDSVDETLTLYVLLSASGSVVLALRSLSVFPSPCEASSQQSASKYQVQPVDISVTSTCGITLERTLSRD